MHNLNTLVTRMKCMNRQFTGQPSSFFPSKHDDVAEEQGYLRYMYLIAQ